MRPFPSPPVSESERILDADQMRRVIRRMAGEIVDRSGGAAGVMLAGIRTRGVPLAERLADLIEEMEGTRPPVGVLDINLYRDDLSTIGAHPVVRETRLPRSIEEWALILCDDVLYTGRTIRAALDELVDYGRPSRVELAVLVDRGLRELPIQPDVVGRSVETRREQRIDVRFEETDGVDEVLLSEGESETGDGG
jgi:pyrimidine operon attenuation protein/uracil phosphoribosyltransferase